MTGIFTTLPDGIVNGVTQDTNSMVIETTGPYEIKVWASMTSSVNNTNVAYKFAINGVIGTARRPRARIGTTGDRVSVAAHGYINLTAGDVVTLWFASDQTANITIEDAVFSVEIGDYKSASVEMLNSTWARQVGSRAKRLSKQMLTGEWQ
ncbi:hypothetical protein D3C84_908020 [compost metagenome]